MKKTPIHFFKMFGKTVMGQGSPLWNKKIDGRLNLTSRRLIQVYANILRINIADFKGVILDKLAARFNYIAHQRRKDFIGFDRITDSHLQ